MAINKPNVLAKHKANKRRCGEENCRGNQTFGGYSANSREIHYNYDPSGNRIGQAYGYDVSWRRYFNYTWQVRDAQGNVMAVYQVKDKVTSASAGTLKLTEHYIYGSSRLGVVNRDMNADQFKHTPDNGNNRLGTAYLINFTRGNKLFEMQAQRSIRSGKNTIKDCAAIDEPFRQCNGNPHRQKVARSC